MSKYGVKPLFPKDLRTYPLQSRASKVDVNDFTRPWKPGESFQDFLATFPNILAGRDFKEFVGLLASAAKKEKARIFSLGAHIIKVGLNPILIDLLREGWISALALNGAGIVHDFEIALSGKTSEEIDSQLKNGRFGMAQETGAILNEAINSGADEDIGMGEAVGKAIYESDFPFKRYSLMSAAYELGIPVTVHVGVGTDIIHFHPKASGEAIGKSSLRDFFLFCALVKELAGGGVYINAGSAVILPEVFLKAVTYVRNQGYRLEDFSTAVFDFIHHYRPYHNIIKRPIKGKGKGFYFIGHHEILIPLLVASLKTVNSKQ